MADLIDAMETSGAKKPYVIALMEENHDVYGNLKDTLVQLCEAKGLKFAPYIPFKATQ